MVGFMSTQRERKRAMGRLKRFAAIAAMVLVILAASLKGARAQSIDGSSKIIGIDLGTTQSVVSLSFNGKTEIIANEQGNRITPSMVAFASDEILVGDTAYNQMGRNPTNTIFDVKRFIGRTFDDPTVQKDVKLLPFEVVDKNNKPYFSVQYKGKTQQFSAEEISAMILKKLKQTAEAYLGEEVSRAVITVPAYFDDTQKQATKDAGTIAGLEVVRIINEPTSAAIAFGIDRHTQQSRETNVMIYDLGGGTFDVSLLTMDDGIFEVVATGGDSHLGGEDFDENVVRYMMKQFKKKHNIDLRGNERALSKLRRECEKAKRALSSAKQTKIEIENLADGVDLSEMLTRARFEDLNSKLFRKTLKPMEQVLADSGLQKNQIDEIVLVGGSTRIPKIHEMVKQFFNGKAPNRGIHPDEAVAYGASIQAAMLGDHWCDETTGEGCDGMAPLVIDAASLSLGIETVGGVMTKVIERGTNYPVSKSKVFSTHQDNQDSVLIQVFQGERAETKHNRRLGQFMLTGIPPQPRGTPQIEVKFAIDANGLLQVEAFEVGQGPDNAKSIVIDRDDHNLSDEEIEEIIDRAQQFQDDDEQFLKRNNAKQQLETSVFGLKQKVYDKQGEMEEETYDVLMELCNEMVDWMDDNGDSAEYEDFVEKQREFDEVAAEHFGPYQHPQQSDEDSYSDHEDL